MSQFQFNWKKNIPDVQQNFVDPNGVRGTMASAQMQGYNPQAQLAAQQVSGYAPNAQPNYRGMGPSQATAEANASLAQQNYDAFNEQNAVLEQKKQKLSELESQLQEVNSQIARIDNEYPEIAGASRDEIEIAAKRAEAGDMSAYNNILARQQGANAGRNSASAGIENMLYEAEKLTGALKGKSQEEREVIRSNITATLRRAEEQARKNGVPLPESYGRLKSAMEDFNKDEERRDSERSWANTLWSKARKNELTDEDIAEIDDYIDRNPNSELSTEIRKLRAEYAPKTKESKAKLSKRKSDARGLYEVLSNLSRDELARRVRNLSSYERKLLEDFYPDFLK